VNLEQWNLNDIFRLKSTLETVIQLIGKESSADETIVELYSYAEILLEKISEYVDTTTRYNQTLVTRSQLKILLFIHNYFTENKHAPSVREIQEAMKYKSPASISYHTRKLIEAGLLNDRGIRRGLYVNPNVIESLTLQTTV
jgi:sulfur relay (sulfurtransferase) DsrC/TusE family protein